jgi:catechol 2,3-dioxygenase
MTDFVRTPSVPAPDIVRCAYMEIVVTNLAKSREFYVDVLGLHVTEEDENNIYLRPLEEFIHHNLVLRKGPIAAVAAFAYRVKSPAEVDARRGLLQGTGLPHRTPQGRLHQGHRRLSPRRGPAGLPLRVLLRCGAR